MDQNSIIKSYKRVSGFYDLTFGQVFRPGQKAIIKKMDCIESDNVLEIGIGTGSSLQYYPKETKVVGIDISPDMLEVAKKRIIKDKIPNKHILLMFIFLSAEIAAVLGVVTSAFGFAIFTFFSIDACPTAIVPEVQP